MTARRLLLIALLLALPSVAAGQDDEDEAADDAGPAHARPGIYVGLQGGVALENFTNASKNGVHANPSGSAAARVGYRVSPVFAIEVLGEALPGFGNQKKDGWWLGANGKAYLVSDLAQPYVLIGAGLIQAPVPGKQERRESLAFRMGGGIDVYFTDHIGVLIEGVYVQPTWNDMQRVPYGVVSMGVFYRF